MNFLLTLVRIRPRLRALPPFDERLHLVVGDIAFLQGLLNQCLVVADCREFAVGFLECLRRHVKLIGEYRHHAFDVGAFLAQRLDSRETRFAC